MYTYDIVEYNKTYFVRRRLFGKLFEAFFVAHYTNRDVWFNKIDLVEYLNELPTFYDASKLYSEIAAVSYYERLSGIAKLKAKHQASKAEFKVYGS